MPSDGLFGPLFAPDEIREAVSGRAWLAAMLEAEAALARAEARAGVVPGEAADRIVSCCDAARFDPDALGTEGRDVGNPAEPLVRRLREEVGDEAAGFVHWGATSQDILDTASMLVARRALDLILSELDAAAGACARLADTYRSTPMAGRTLLQQAVPTTFGSKAAGWLVGLLDGRRLLVRVRDERLAAELGGAAGTLAALGGAGPEVLRLFAEELGLAEPVVPWHAQRARIAELGGALDVASGTLAKIGLDIALLAQTEVGEVVVRPGGGSSTMPHKRNPVDSTIAVACARRVNALAGVLSGGLASEHERAAGSWHAEWEPLSDALALTGGAADRIRAALDGLEVDPERMRRNLDLTGAALLAERVELRLAERVGRSAARELVAAAVSADSFRDGLAQHVDPVELDELLEPSTYAGAADVFVDRALAFARQELGG